MECVLCCTARDSEWMKQARGNIWEALAPCDEFGPCKLYARNRTIEGLEPVWTNLQATVSFSSSIQLEMMPRINTGWANYLVISSNKVQRMHRYDWNCMSVWKIARNLKLAIRLKLLRPVSNSKYLGLRELLHRVRTLSSCEELLSQHFSPSWPGRVRQTMELERLSRRGIRPVYENGWDVCYNAM